MGDLGNGHQSGIVDNTHPRAGSVQSVHADSSSIDGKVYQFNEQTNYVPKSTIITVGYLMERCFFGEVNCGRSSLPAQPSISWLSWTKLHLQPVYTLSEIL